MHVLTRSTVLVIAAMAAVGGLAACSSSDSGSSATVSPLPVSPVPQSGSVVPSGTATGALCNITDLVRAIPSGASVTRYACGSTGQYEIAAVEANPGKTVFWVRRQGDQWVSDQGLADQICGAASAGYSDEILSFCLPKPKDPQ